MKTHHLIHQSCLCCFDCERVMGEMKETYSIHSGVVHDDKNSIKIIRFMQPLHIAERVAPLGQHDKDKLSYWRCLFQMVYGWY